jgi:hypothetical protein
VRSRLSNVLFSTAYTLIACLDAPLHDPLELALHSRVFIRKMISVVQWLLLSVLFLDFMLAHKALTLLHLGSRTPQVVLCAAFGACQMCFWLIKKDPENTSLGIGACFATAAGASMVYVGMLEIAQLITPDRHARVIDFVYNSAGVGTGAVTVIVACCVPIFTDRLLRLT